MCVAYVCYVRFHAQQIAVQKQIGVIPCYSCDAATVLAVQVREYLKINVLGTIPYFVDGNVKILRHIQNSWTWDCAAASRKDRNIDYHGHSFHVHSLEEDIPQWIYL